MGSPSASSRRTSSRDCWAQSPVGRSGIHTARAMTASSSDQFPSRVTAEFSRGKLAKSPFSLEAFSEIVIFFRGLPIRICFLSGADGPTAT